MAGRPRRVQPNDLIPLAAAMCTQAEAAKILGLSHRGLEFLLTKAEYREVWDRCRNDTRLQLRRAQLDSALVKGDRVSLIWLGKQYLEQRDAPHMVENKTDVQVRFIAEWGGGVGGQLPAAEDESVIEGAVSEEDDDE